MLRFCGLELTRELGGIRRLLSSLSIGLLWLSMTNTESMRSRHHSPGWRQLMVVRSDRCDRKRMSVARDNMLS